MTYVKPFKKPLLRGYFHQEAFYIALGACALLIAKSTANSISLTSCLIYSFGLLFLFGVSAIYHRPHWEPKQRAILKRFDHSAIFITIAGTFTPICLMALPQEMGYQLLIVVWIAAITGIAQSIFWVKAPKFITAIFYVVMGWFALPYLGELKVSLGMEKLSLIFAGGVVYTIGAVFYALKKPKLFPHIFGYHELFHIFTIIGATLHFIVIYQLVNLLVNRSR